MSGAPEETAGAPPGMLFCPGNQALHALAFHWLVSRRIRIMRGKLQRLDNLPSAPHPPPAQHPPPRWFPHKIAALFVARCLRINERRFTVTYTLSHTRPQPTSLEKARLLWMFPSLTRVKCEGADVGGRMTRSGL